MQNHKTNEKVFLRNKISRNILKTAKRILGSFIFSFDLLKLGVTSFERRFLEQKSEEKC